MVLRHVVGAVEGTLPPIYVELSLADTISNPVETHVHCFTAFLFDTVVGYASGCAIVRDKWCGRLWVSHLLQCQAQECTGLLGIVEDGAKFSHSSTGENLTRGLAEDVHRAIGKERGCGTGVGWCG